MALNSNELSKLARRAVRNQEWETVAACANSILRLSLNDPEGYFLTGLVERISNRPLMAMKAFEKVLELDRKRYDAAIELANQYSVARRNSDAEKLLDEYKNSLSNSPMYLDLAGTIYTDIGMPQHAYPLYLKANELQPEVDLFQANLASCSVFLGKIEEAKTIYHKLLKRFPNHQRNHYQLARLGKANTSEHIEQMKRLLASNKKPPSQNIFLYFAIGKELEDLEQWSEAFHFYKKGGDAVCSVAEYDVETDISLINSIIETCDSEWLNSKSQTVRFEDAQTLNSSERTSEHSPIFIVGLPRTGTTLTERIISSHSQVQSLGETQFLQMVLRRESGVQTVENINSDIITAAAKVEPQAIMKGYIDSVNYRLGSEPSFIDKLPFNFLFLGFIAKAWPDAKIVHVRRNPMDSCFSMFKQVFTWAYKFSYSLESLADYFIAHNKLTTHWRETLGDRLVEVNYETLVSDTENQTRVLLNKLGLEFEQGCLDFDRNKTPSATASSVQIREKAHNRSVNKWLRYETELEPLKSRLIRAGINLDDD